MKKFALIMTTFLLGLLALSLPSASWLGDLVGVTRAETPGQDGNLVVTSPNTIVNRYATLATDAAAGATAITIANPGGTFGLDASTLAAGNLLLIIQMQGAQIDTSDSASYGNITDLRNAGRYEFVTVGSVTGNTITLSCGGLRYSYTASGKVQVIRVPQYSALTVNPGASLTAPAWNGTTGGIVAAHVQNTASINGTIDVSGLGFRGGALMQNGIGFGQITYRSGDPEFGAEKGEGIAGSQSDYDALNGRLARGAPANGGGGGTSHNSGGGGGANGNNGNIYTGAGVMSGAVVGAAAWALDPEFISNGNTLTNSSGGGRGGYSYSDPLIDQNALVVGPGNGLWEGDSRRAVGGRGGRPVSNDPAGRLFVGGGGGAAHQNDLDGGMGGNGGGLVYILSNIVNGSGVIRANGTNGADSIDENRDGGGGGGGGGSVVVVSNALSGVSIEARGGNGGNHNKPIGRFTNEGHGPGGGGGGGFVALSGGAVTTNIAGGVGGVSLAATLTEFPSNGATNGASGGTGAVTSIPFSCATDLAVVKTTDATAFAPGGPVSYLIRVTNNGPNAVTAAPVVDTFAVALGGVTWTCTATAGSSCAAPNGNGNINTTVNLAVGGTATFVVNGTLAATASGNLVNTATVSLPAGALDPVPGNNTSTVTTPITAGVSAAVRTRFITNTCVGPNRFLTVESVVSNQGPGIMRNNPGAEFVAQLPAQLDLVLNSCTSSSGNCSIVGSQVEWNGTLNPGQAVNISFQVRVRNNAIEGIRFCVLGRVRFDTNGDGDNDTTATSQACATVNCPPDGPDTPSNPGPGIPIRDDVPSDQKPGSVLLYPIYASSSAQPNSNNTRINMTNTHTTQSTTVHLFFIDGRGCAVVDRYVCLTPNQTTSFLISEFDPDTTGYLIAVAVNEDGCPINFNYLIGSEQIKTTAGGVNFRGDIGAEAIPAIATAIRCDPTSNLATLTFDGLQYARVPTVLAHDNIGSFDDGNRVWLILDSFSGNLAISAANIGTIIGLLFDDEENPYSFSFSAICQFRGILGDEFPRVSPRFRIVIPSGQTGWMKLASASGAGFFGVAFNTNTTDSGFNGAHTLHKLTLAPTTSLTIPIFQPGC